MDKFIPTSGEKGFYRLKAPFSVPDNSIHTCKSIRKISELLASEIDPYTEYYKPYNIDIDRYEEEVALDVEIIGLLEEGGGWIHVPSTYLEGYPSMNGIPYRKMALVVGLPAFAVSQDFTHLETAIADKVTSTMGVACTTKMVVMSKTLLKNSDDHELLKTQRLAASQGTTDAAQAAYWKSKYEDLLFKHNQLLNAAWT